MTSESAGSSTALYVWVWPPGAAEPVPAGVLENPPGSGVVTFAYGRSYLEAPVGGPLYGPELPLRSGRQEPGPGLDAPGVIRDAGPDAWGQRVIMRRLSGRRDIRDLDPGDVPLLTYLLESGSDRPGALDFQQSPSEYIPRTHDATLEQLQQAASDMESGAPLDQALQEALVAGSSVGGARPKATLRSGDRHLIAKFSSLTDTFPVMKGEAVAMELARRVGLDVAPTELVQTAGRAVLLVERFDRRPGGVRRGFVSALTVLGESEMNARYATYTALADELRARAPARALALRELFGRIVLSILVGNTDDHARNHAAFHGPDGELELTPAYDICPQLRSGEEAAQAMSFGPQGQRLSQLALCLEAAPHYDLTSAQAREIIDSQLSIVREQWDDAADAAMLTTAEREQLWGRQVLNPFATYGYAEG